MQIQRTSTLEAGSLTFIKYTIWLAMFPVPKIGTFLQYHSMIKPTIRDLIHTVLCGWNAGWWRKSLSLFAWIYLTYHFLTLYKSSAAPSCPNMHRSQLVAQLFLCWEENRSQWSGQATHTPSVKMRESQVYKYISM